MDMDIDMDMDMDNDLVINNVVIVAAGQGSRLLPLTRYIPKLLVNCGNTNMLSRIITYWKLYTPRFTIVLQSQYIALVRSYIKIIHPNLDITLISFDMASGTADTIHRTIEPQDRVIFTWCDVCPIGEINKSVFDLEKVAFLYGTDNRYAYDSGELRPGSGGVCGVYYFRRFTGLNYNNTELDERNGVDIADVMGSGICKYELDGLIDIGDIPKLTMHTSGTVATRYFNDIQVEEKKGEGEGEGESEGENNVCIYTKTARCPYGLKIMQNEQAWYKEIKRLNCRAAVATVLETSDGMLKLEGAPGTVTYKIISPHNESKIVSAYIQTLRQLHIYTIPVPHIFVYNCIQEETINKAKRRNGAVREILNLFPAHTVNGIKVKCEEDILFRIHSILTRHFKDRKHLAFIHGDSQFGNSCYSDKKDLITLFDPRGYFGQSHLYGVEEYDYAKLLFALTGYDSFNDNPFFHIMSYDDKGEKITFSIPSHNTDYEFINKAVIAFMVSIWLCLPQYFQNDISKCVCAYYHGLYLGTLLLFKGESI